MNKIIKYIGISVTALFAAACSLDREPLTGPSTGSFPASFEEVQAGVLAAYKTVSDNFGDAYTQFQPTIIRWIDNITDIGVTRLVLNNWQDYSQSLITSSHEAVEYQYKCFYRTISRVHLVLDSIDNIRGELTDEEYYQFKAEMLCVRAFCYDILCQLYGAVPFIDHSLSLSDCAYARTPKEEVVENIISDLDDDLLENLPISWTKSSWGSCRIGRVAAFALKARICLNWGYFEEAAKASKKAMDYAEGVYDLTPLDCTYYQNHIAGEPDPTPLFGYAAETDSKEWIWSLSYSRLIDGNYHDGIYTFASRVQNGASSAGPSLALMDTFQCTDGKSIVDSDLYDWKDPWKNRDPRLDLYCARTNSRVMGTQLSIDPADVTVMDYNLGSAVSNNDVTGNKSEYGPNGITGVGGFLWRKFCDPSYYGQITGTGYKDELDYVVIRLAELLLVDAEANIEWDGGDLARAKSDIDRVRARVNMPEVGSTRDELRSALRYERKVELCCEGFRWFDIRRWKGSDGNPIAYYVQNYPQYAPGFGETLSNAKPIIDENWTVVYDGITTFDGDEFNARVHAERSFKLNKDELWPFPYSEMVTNELIGTGNNNPGY